MNAKRLLLMLFCFCLFGLYFSCTNNNQQTAEEKIDFTNYYYTLNSAMDAKQKADTTLCLQHLHQALSLISQQKEIPTPYYLLSAILRMTPQISEKDVQTLLSQHPIVNDKPDDFYQSFDFNPKLVEWVKKHALIESPSKYYHPDHLELSARLDTLSAFDQGLLGYTEDRYEKYYSDTIWYFINHIEEGEAYLFDQLLDIHKEYGLLGFNSCKKCDNLYSIYLHLNKKEFEQIKNYLQKTLDKGYLTSNQFAVIYDRCYSELGEANKEFFYYFNLYERHVSEDFKTVGELSSEEKEIINQRRKEIGIPPLPYEFCNLLELRE